MHPLLTVVLVFMTATTIVVGQVDTSFFKDLPPDEELKKAGMATREEMRKTMRQMKGIMHDMDSGWKASRENLKETAHATRGEEEDAPLPQTLEEKILNPSGIHVLLIDLKAHPISKLPEGFDNLSDLQFLVITNLPDGARFDFDDAFNTIARLPNVKDLYVINNGKGLRAIPASIGQMSELKRLTCYNNAITTIHADVGNLESLEVLSLEENPISPAQYAALQTALPECTITYTKAR